MLWSCLQIEICYQFWKHCIVACLSKSYLWNVKLESHFHLQAVMRSPGLDAVTSRCTTRHSRISARPRYFARAISWRPRHFARTISWRSGYFARAFSWRPRYFARDISWRPRYIARVYSLEACLFCKGYFLEVQIFCKGYFLEAKILCKGNFLKARPYHVQGHAQFGSVVSGGVIGRRPCGMLCENMEVSSFVPHILWLLLATKGIS